MLGKANSCWRRGGIMRRRFGLGMVHIFRRVGISDSFVNPENLGFRIWQEKNVNYHKIEIPARLCISHI